MAAGKELFLVAQLDPSEDDPDRDALYDLGVIATAMQMLKLPDGTVRVLVEGAKRARLVNLTDSDGHQQAEVELVDEEEAEGPEAQALMRSVIDQFDNWEVMPECRTGTCNDITIEWVVKEQSPVRMSLGDLGHRARVGEQSIASPCGRHVPVSASAALLKELGEQ